MLLDNCTGLTMLIQMGPIIAPQKQGQGSSCFALQLRSLNILSTCCKSKHSCVCRLNTVLTCNRVLVLNAGTVEEFDTPQKLVQVCVLCGGLTRCLTCFRLAVLHEAMLRVPGNCSRPELVPLHGPKEHSSSHYLLSLWRLPPISTFVAAEPPRRFLCNDEAIKHTSCQRLDSSSNNL